MQEENIQNLLKHREYQRQQMELDIKLSKQSIKNPGLGIPEKENCFKIISQKQKNQLKSVKYFILNYII